MNFKRVYICGIISILWWLSEALSIRVYENTSEINNTPLKLNASPTQNINPVLPTIPGRENNFGEPQRTSDKLPETNSTESIVKAQIFVAENQKVNSLPGKNSKTSSALSHVEQENDKKSGKILSLGKQQKWQIPSPLSLSAASDLRSINSSKRQTDDNFQSDFVPSLQVGSFDDTQGFVPHSYHEPKAITYAHTVYGLKKPTNHDISHFNREREQSQSMNTFSEIRSPNNNKGSLSNHDYGGTNFPYNSLSDSRFNSFGEAGLLTNSYGEPRLPIHDLADFKLPINSFGKTKISADGERESVQQMNGYGGPKLPTNNFEESKSQVDGYGQSRIPNGGSEGIRFPTNDLTLHVNSFEASKQAINDINGLRLPNTGAGTTFKPVNGLKAFQNDFDNLKNKYPELNELVSNYPIMEEMMKQKLAEKFQQNFQLGQHSLSSAENIFGGYNHDGSIGERLKLHDQTKIYISNFKFPSTEDGKIKIPDIPHLVEGRPFHYEFEKPNWSLHGKKPGKQEDDNSHEVPAGEIYQGSKFPITSYAFDDHKHGSDDHKHASEEHKKPEHAVGDVKHGISPWKRVLHMLTAFIPVGILISALTPSIVNINNTADRTYPIRQRALYSSQPSAVTGHLLEIIKGSLMESNDQRHQNLEDPGCDDRNFCEMAKRGEDSSAILVEKIFWKLAHDIPDDVAERARMKKLFKAIKSRDCNAFICKKPQRTNTTESTERTPRDVPSVLEDDEVETEEGLDESYVDDDGDHFATTTSSPIVRGGVLRRGKRVHD